MLKINEIKSITSKEVYLGIIIGRLFFMDVT